VEQWVENIDVSASTAERIRQLESEADGNNKLIVPSGFVRDCLLANELGDGELYSALNRGRFIFVASRDRWFRWAGHHWDIDYLHESLMAVEEVARVYIDEAQKVSVELTKEENKDQSKSLARMHKNLIDRVKALRGDKRREHCLKFSRTCSQPLAIVGTELDCRPWLIACTNGVINLKTGDLRPGRQDDFIHLNCKTEYLGLNEPCPLWEKAVMDICNDSEDLYLYMQRLLGYSIVGLNLERVFSVWFGDTHNGKSTIAETMSMVLGDYSGPIQSEMLLDNGPRNPAGPTPDVMSLKGMRQAFASETPEGRRFNAAKVKWYTGNDMLRGRSPNDKYETVFKPTHTLFLLTNHLPHVSAEDRAFWSRCQAVEFTQFFCDNPSAPNQRKKDKDLLFKLQAEAPGILAWLVRGCLAWQERGLDPPPIVLETTAQYRVGEDIMAKFIEERCEVGDEAVFSAKSSELSEAYQEWYASNISKKSIPSSITIGKKLSKIFLNNYKSGGHTVYRGIRLLV
jgi:putative DNA primase/helicase